MQKKQQFFNKNQNPKDALFFVQRSKKFRTGQYWNWKPLPDAKKEIFLPIVWQSQPPVQVYMQDNVMLAFDIALKVR